MRTAFVMLEMTVFDQSDDEALVTGLRAALDDGWESFEGAASVDSIDVIPPDRVRRVGVVAVPDPEIEHEIERAARSLVDLAPAALAICERHLEPWWKRPLRWWKRFA